MTSELYPTTRTTTTWTTTTTTIGKRRSSAARQPGPTCNFPHCSHCSHRSHAMAARPHARTPARPHPHVIPLAPHTPHHDRLLSVAPVARRPARPLHASPTLHLRKQQTLHSRLCFAAERASFAQNIPLPPDGQPAGQPPAGGSIISESANCARRCVA